MKQKKGILKSYYHRTKQVEYFVLKVCLRAVVAVESGGFRVDGVLTSGDLNGTILFKQI